MSAVTLEREGCDPMTLLLNDCLTTMTGASLGLGFVTLGYLNQMIKFLRLVSAAWFSYAQV
ncbi:hypothetical protein GCM10007876_35700 [Litoribrevibacter albus]|uniref:Uncharacterized protein n=1 Tax=Litoribrevibacter albus TaxID=1473156 RepID=A0AA37SDH4_9GAMM|nr:hypothetical protein GCM10007876_35700 [Litoribrevibacter albus]